jgi:hypothetical protein
MHNNVTDPTFRRMLGYTNHHRYRLMTLGVQVRLLTFGMSMFNTPFVEFSVTYTTCEGYKVIV